MFKTNYRIFRDTADTKHLDCILRVKEDSNKIRYAIVDIEDTDSIDLWTLLGVTPCNMEHIIRHELFPNGFNQENYTNDPLDIVLYGNDDIRMLGYIFEINLSLDDCQKILDMAIESYGEELGYVVFILKIYLSGNREKLEHFIDRAIPVDDMMVFKNEIVKVCDGDIDVHKLSTEYEYYIHDYVDIMCSKNHTFTIDEKYKFVVIMAIENIQSRELIEKLGITEELICKLTMQFLQVASRDDVINTSTKDTFLYKVRNLLRLRLFLMMAENPDKVINTTNTRIRLVESLLDTEYGHLVPSLLIKTGQLYGTISFEPVYPLYYTDYNRSIGYNRFKTLGTERVQERIFYLNDLLHINTIEQDELEITRANMCIDNIFFEGQNQAYEYLTTDGRMKHEN